MLNSYNTYNGTETTSSENGSPDGVIIAAIINTAHMACLLKDFRTSRVSRPNEDKANATVGNSNTMPKVITIDVNIEIYELNEKVFGMSGLT